MDATCMLYVVIERDSFSRIYYIDLQQSLIRFFTKQEERVSITSGHCLKDLNVISWKGRISAPKVFTLYVFVAKVLGYSPEQDDPRAD